MSDRDEQMDTPSHLWDNYDPDQKLDQPIRVAGTTFHRGCSYGMLQRAIPYPHGEG